MGFSLVAVSRGCSAVPGPVFLTAAASLMEHRGVQLLLLKPLEHKVRSCGAQALLLRDMWPFPDQGPNPSLLHWQVDCL